MKKLTLMIILLLGTLSIQSAEKIVITEKHFDNPDMIEMRYGSQDGFWLSSYLAEKSAKAVNYWNALQQTLGFTDDNFSTKIKQIYKLDFFNKILICAVIVISILLFGFVGGVVACIFVLRYKL